MARRRWIDPGFWTDPHVGKLSPQERLLFLGCVSAADDEGRLLASPAYLRAQVFPYDDISFAEVEEMRNRMVSVCRNVVLYEVDGVEYLAFMQWRKYQNPSHPSPSKLPAPPGVSQEECANSSGDIREVLANLSGDSPPRAGAGFGFGFGVGSNTPLPPSQGGEGGGADEDQHDPESVPKRRRELGDYTPDFEEFWQRYPRRVEKRRAFRAWKATLKRSRPDALITAQMLQTAARHYADDCSARGTDERYIKHAATFLGPDEPWREWLQPPRASPNGEAVGPRWLAEKRFVPEEGEPDVPF